MGKGSRLRKQGNREDAVIYWHGGAAGRRAGDELVPGVQVPGYRHVVSALSPESFADYRPDYAYITSDRNLAFDFAAQYFKLGLGPAAVYKVVPVGKTSHDPDYPVGVSFRCRAARVLTVEPDVFNASTPETGAALGYTTWDDDSPMYDASGYPLPNKLQQHFGVGAHHLWSLGKGAGFPEIHRRCSEVLKQLGVTQSDINEYQRSIGGRPLVKP
ncbi:hypothetical protein WBN73_21205 [Paenarthrobacter sp. CCNWLY172]|uniref:hypothetical protein n=1 Tax=unclassified Paenarthrobacter TaxID=2634190 RepID=UPI003077CDDA